jgi:drug/metabolite transporter (DMT)-like permease
VERRARTIACTVFALTAFAANSLLCRQALRPNAIDPASFSTIRLVSGAATLSILAALTRRGSFQLGGTWGSAAMLFLYAIPFSFAYVSLGAGTGALILFGAVQGTMLLAALASGEWPHLLQWTGLLLALAGLVYLVLPGITAPAPAGSALMAVAGIAWGIYSVRGRGAADPLGETAGNFARAVPLVLIVGLWETRQLHATSTGALLAVVSGALASGVGYVAWYAALTGLSATRAASVQLAVPLLAAAGGVAFLSERITLRLVVAAVLILGGVALALAGRERPAGKGSPTA